MPLEFKKIMIKCKLFGDSGITFWDNPHITIEIGIKPAKIGLIYDDIYKQ